MAPAGSATPDRVNLVMHTAFNPNATTGWFAGIMDTVNTATMHAIVLTGAGSIPLFMCSTMTIRRRLRPGARISATAFGTTAPPPIGVARARPSARYNVVWPTPRHDAISPGQRRIGHQPARGVEAVGRQARLAPARCLIPGFDGAIFSRAWKDALWARFSMVAPPVLFHGLRLRNLGASATTTAAIRRAIQHSQESLRSLSKRYGINPKTVAKWKSRSSVHDLPTGPKQAQSTVLSVDDEAVVVAFRRH